MMVQHHVLLITYPAQGHINPALQFVNRLIRIGVHVTFVINTSIRHRMTQLPTLHGLTLVDFSDGYDRGFNGAKDDIDHYLSNLKSCGTEKLTEIITDSAIEGRPINCLVYTLLLPWAAEVARRLHVPSALLWIQPATVFDLYYYYFNGYGDIIRSKLKEDPSCSIELPNLPLPFTSRDLPSFCIPTNTYKFALPLFQEQLELLAGETNPKVLVNTFDTLEPEGLSAVDSIKLVGIGPLIQSDSSIAAHLYQPSDQKYMEWLSSKPESSVVYVSFGSISVLSKRQMEEMERGLLESGQTFLWVIRGLRNGDEEEEKKEGDYYKLMSSKELNGNMIVPWCAQVEVLSHPSVGCFVTHCGWNSTLESLVCGVPMVTFPQWTDQGTNAMLVEDVWKTGVRVRVSDQEDGLVDGDEIKRCLEIVMGGGERGEEIRKNAMNWKGLARDAVEEGGSSDKNLRAFVNEIAK